MVTRYPVSTPLVLAIKPGHDGAIACIEGDRLLFSHEGEKGGHPRHSDVTVEAIRLAAQHLPRIPDLVVWSGWYKYLDDRDVGQLGGYLGVDPGPMRRARFFGGDVLEYSPSHERSHLYCAAGLAPDGPPEEATILLWEGQIGAVYDWRDYGREIVKHDVMYGPGARYAALFGIADPDFPDEGEVPPARHAGKLMALAGYGSVLTDGPTESEARVVETLLTMERVYPFDKARFSSTDLYNAGVHTPQVHRAAHHLTERLFDTFMSAIKRSGLTGRPLLIVGGCGLNCDWNSRFRASGLFPSVFVPPVCNDSGTAIGAAVDGLSVLRGMPPRIDWSVFAGEEFRWNTSQVPNPWFETTFGHDTVAAALAAGDVVAWVSGKAEIGPRALGHRSLLASPLLAASKDRLNHIKRRDDYRPIAPVTRADDLATHFSPPEPNEYMLYFHTVNDPALLPAVTHVDGSARVQTVTDRSSRLHRLLDAFAAETGAGVLCNTSLNFPGCGFINQSSELFSYCTARDVDAIVVEGRLFRRR